MASHWSESKCRSVIGCLLLSLQFIESDLTNFEKKVDLTRGVMDEDDNDMEEDDANIANDRLNMSDLVCTEHV